MAIYALQGHRLNTPLLSAGGGSLTGFYGFSGATGMGGQGVRHNGQNNQYGKFGFCRFLSVSGGKKHCIQEEVENGND